MNQEASQRQDIEENTSNDIDGENDKADDEDHDNDNNDDDDDDDDGDNDDDDNDDDVFILLFHQPVQRSPIVALLLTGSHRD